MGEPTTEASKVNEFGHRIVDEKMLEAPTYKYVCGVALCLGCGACCADYNMSQSQPKPEPPKLSVDMNDPVAGKEALHNYFVGARQNPDNGIYCAAPMQVTMPGGSSTLQFSPKNPDCFCNLCSILCCWRGGAVMYFMAMAIPSVLAAKYGLGLLAMGSIFGCLLIAVVARCCAFLPCCKKCFNMKTPSLRESFLNVIDMKRSDAYEADAAGKKGFQDKISWNCTQVGKYCEAICGGIFCCRFCMPTTIFTFAKVLFAMMFTEVGMVVSAYLYSVGRFMCGSGCWTMGSLVSWVREFLVSMALKKRIIQMKYPEWGYNKDKGKEEEKRPDNCFDSCIAGCCGLPCCQMCQCELCCEICCPLFCELCDMTLDIFGEFMSALLLTGKALFYTDRLFLAGKRNNNSNAAGASA